MAYYSERDFGDDEAELKAAVEAARLAWLTRWPDHCTFCHGAGGDYDVRSDVTYPCRCLLLRRCPRCAAATDPLLGSPTWACIACEWTPGRDSLSDDASQCP